jgi:hypothetical protein
MGGDDLAFEPLPDQLRDSADMVDMGMRDEKEIDLRRLDRPGIHRKGTIPALDCPAIHQDIESVGSHKMARARDALIPAKVNYLKGHAQFHHSK